MLLIVLDSEMRFSLSKLDTLIFPNQRCSWKVESMYIYLLSTPVFSTILKAWIYFPRRWGAVTQKWL